jgi:hypothetical protein
MFISYRLNHIFTFLCAVVTALFCAHCPLLAADPEHGSQFEATPAEQEVLRLTNDQRRENGLQPLNFNAKLAETARQHSANMARSNTLAHTLEGSTMTSRIKASGYPFLAIGENIAFNDPTPEAVLNSWMHSPGHRANILNKNFTELGVGIADDVNGEPYYTQDFGRPVSAGPTEQATFSITNKSGAPAAIKLPGNESKALLDDGSTGSFSVAGTGDLPPIEITVGTETKKLNFEDGAAYVVRKSGAGLLDVEREPVK